MADPNRTRFETAVRLLAPLLDELVFVGGSTAGVFISDPAATTIRPTKDIDAIVDVASYAQYTALSDRLRALGFMEDTSEDAPLCRWRNGTTIIDVLPTSERVLGFTNRWYPAAVATARTIRIAGHNARIVTPVLFVATKLEAFHGRGAGDVVASHDLEDIVTVIDGRPELVEEVAGAPDDVRAFIAAEIRDLLAHADFIEALPGFLLPDRASQARLPLLVERLKMLTESR